MAALSLSARTNIRQHPGPSVGSPQGPQKKEGQHFGEYQLQVPLHHEGRTCRRDFPATWTAQRVPRAPRGRPGRREAAGGRTSPAPAAPLVRRGVRFAHGAETKSTRTCGFLGGRVTVLAND